MIFLAILGSLWFIVTLMFSLALGLAASRPIPTPGDNPPIESPMIPMSIFEIFT